MDPLTHLVITRRIGRDRATLVAGLAPDLPFYLTYPPWLIAHQKLGDALRTNDWPAAPAWMYLLHHIAHSLPLVALVAVVWRALRGRWPRWALAWAVHILVDIPTHSRRNWAPQFLWPLSTITIDGISWPELLVRATRRSAEDWP